MIRGGPETMTDNDTRTEKIKYISCGRCKIWFFAPKDSIFVVCPQCDVINNCGKPKVIFFMNAERIWLFPNSLWMFMLYRLKHLLAKVQLQRKLHGYIVILMANLFLSFSESTFAWLLPCLKGLI